MPDENKTGTGSEGAGETIDQIHDAHLSAFEAWQAEPDKPELKEVATKATAKWKDAFAADKKTREEAAAKNKPPENYDLKLPDGSKLDAKAVDDIAAFAKSNGLSQDAAKALLERENANFAAYVESVETQQKQMLEQEQKAWLKEVQEDKEIGGPNAAKNAELVKRAVAKFGPEGIDKDLEATGLGNHPKFVKLIVRLLKAANFSEDTLVPGGKPPGGERKPTTEVLFPSMTQK